MLDAAAKNKLRLNKEVLIEDEITSTIFGPIAYMKLDEAWKIIKSIAVHANILESNTPSAIPNYFKINFWPNHQKNHQNVQPDIACRFQFDDKTACNILIEIKWRAGLYPPCELVRQWLTRPVPHERWLHIHIVPHVTQGKKDIDDSINILKGDCKKECGECSDDSPKYNQPEHPQKEATAWKDCLGFIAWNNIQDIAQKYSESNKSTKNLSRWGEGVHKFLEKHGYIAFIGFKWLDENKYAILDKESNSMFFIKSDWFSFLNDFKYDVLDNSIEYTLFKSK
jgi:hypothetical protein